MKCQQLCEPRSGKLVCQLFGGIIVAYDLHLAHQEDHWKRLAEESNIEKVIHVSFGYFVGFCKTKKRRLGLKTTSEA